MNLDRLQHPLATHKIDALFVTNFYNILYLTGYVVGRPEEREVWALVTNKNLYVFVDGRNIEDAKKYKKSFTPCLISQEKRLSDHLVDICKKENIRQLGFEPQDLNVAEFKHLQKKLKGIKLIETEKLVENLREIKSTEEIQKLKKAATVADQCLEEIIMTINEGQTEGEIAYRIEDWFRQKGYAPSFAPIVAFGANAASPHHNSKKTTVKLTKNTLILIDYGVRVDDYCSDTTRMFFYGKPPTEIQKTYDSLRKAQSAIIDSIQNFKNTKDIDVYCRTKMKEYDLPDFAHSTGHGVGLEVHEGPHISPNSKDRINAGQVFTIEPGIYIPGKYGMRIEDMVFVNKSGDIEVLTQFPKNLICL